MAIAVAEKLVLVPPAQAYRAFTNSTSLREWLCDVATVDPHPRGRIYLWWRGGFYSSGHFLELEEDKKVRFRWFSNVDPAPTEITVTLAEKDGCVLVRMEHTVPDDPAWAKTAENFRQEWQGSLENLKSVLETGLDLRIANRPMLGIIPGDFTPEQAQALGVPIREGMRLDGVVDGMGAQKAGLQKDDVLVEMAGKPIKLDADSLPNAISGKKGGDEVQVVFYRGPEKHTTTMELTRRVVPQIPAEPRELAAHLRVNYEQAQKMLTDAFLGASEEEAHFVPAQGEWSAIQTLAHLVLVEREVLSNIDEVLGGFVRHSDEYGSNSTIHNEAIATAYGSVKNLLAEFKRLSEEVITYVSNLPEIFVTIKSDYLNLGNSLLNGSLPHTQGHIEQIKNAILAARK